MPFGALEIAIWRKNPQGESTYCVLNNGSLILRLPWAHGTTFEAIYSMYAEYKLCKHTNAIVVFDGYTTEPSTKDFAHLERTHGISSANVKFNANTPFKSKKDSFYPTEKIYKYYINVLSKCLQERHRYRTTVVDLIETKDVVIIGEDKYLLILMC